jgi:hypothetical protein
VDNVGAIIKFIGPNAEAFGVFLLLSLNASVILLFARSSRRRDVIPLYLAAAGYIATMFAFHSSWFNIRFYFCVLPVLVLGVLPSLLALAPRARTVALAVTLGVNAVLVANYWFVSEGAIRGDALVRAFCDKWGVQIERVAGHVYLVR